MSRGIVCNKCGKEFDMWDEYEGLSVGRLLGYGTKYDGEYLRLNLCCKCLESLIDSCKISPLKNNT